jgi:hypothetical protein
MGDERKISRIEARLDAIEADGTERKADVARLDAFFALIAVLSDQQRFAAEVEALTARAAAAEQAEADQLDQRRRLDEQAATSRSRLESEGTALLKRLVAAESEAEKLSATSKRQKELLRAWTIFGESDAVTSGFASPRRPALFKAHKAHGIADNWQEDPTVPFEEVRPTVPSIFPNRTRRGERHNRRV